MEKIKYFGGEIEYKENANKWQVKIGDVEKEVDSMRDAKGWIDGFAERKKKAEKNKLSKIEPIEAYKQRYDGYKSCKITSYAGLSTYGRHDEVWIVRKGQREKVDVSSLLSISNKEVVEKIRKLENEIEKMEEGLTKLTLIDIAEMKKRWEILQGN